MVSLVALAADHGFGVPLGEITAAVGGLALAICGLVALIRIERRGRTPAQQPSPLTPYQQPMPAMAQNLPHEGAKGRSKGVAIACLIVGGLLALGGITNVALAIQYEVSATKIVIAATAGGLGRVELAPETAAALEDRRAEAADEGLAYQYAGYENSEVDGRIVLFMGVDAKNSNPDRELDSLFASAAKTAGVPLGTVTDYPAGDLGGEVRCALFKVSQESRRQCVWADRSTFGMLIAGADTPEAGLAAMLVKMRPDLERPK
jgi:hypothetical protein